MKMHKFEPTSGVAGTPDGRALFEILLINPDTGEKKKLPVSLVEMPEWKKLIIRRPMDEHIDLLQWVRRNPKPIESLVSVEGTPTRHVQVHTGTMILVFKNCTPKDYVGPEEFRAHMSQLMMEEITLQFEDMARLLPEEDKDE